MSAPEPGTTVSYHAIAGDTWPAEVRVVYGREPFTFVDLDVHAGPGPDDRLHLRAVPWEGANLPFATREA